MRALQLAALLCALPLLAADSSAAITGVWRAQLEGRPALVRSLGEDRGQLAGAVLFYVRDGTPGIPEPLLRLKLDGQALDFQVSLHRAQEPPVSFRLKLLGPNQGKLIREGDETQSIEVLRDK